MLAYFIPSLYNTFGIIDPGQSRLYFVASRYLLPATLVLLTLSIDFRAILRLGPKALIMFLTGILGIILGGPIAVLLVSLVSPETVGGSGPDAVWRGLTTIAGSWIGGSANQAAMKEVFGVGDQIFSAMIAVDVLIGNPWIAQVAPGLERLSLTSQFFWVVVLATTGGLLFSFTRARELEGAGASSIGSVMLYVLIATIGMGMDLGAVVERPGLFALGGIWIAIHAGLLLVVGRAIRAPTFYLAVGSVANVGGAASAPVVASAFHPSLAPVGVLLAVLGYALGTYGAWLTGQLMRLAAP